jgi:pyruvate/2-oxoglutarate dehydrogenase complex dihydrolipoamide dehydrogenase (E3) component
VRVDDTLRTTSPRVFAAGDFTGRMMLVQSATPEAEIAAENAVLGGRRALRHAVVPHGGCADPEYGSVGPTEVEARREQDGTVAVVSYADLDRGSIDRHRVGSCKLIVSRATQCVLGAHIVGEQAVEVVQIAATAMRAAMRVEKLADLELAYPTFTAVVGLAARRISRTLGLVPLASTEGGGSERLRAAEWALRSG